MMKKATIILAFVILGLVNIVKVEAQMPAAQKTVWDVEVKASVNASKGYVWDLLNDNERLQNYSNGHVKSIKSLDEELVVSREVIFNNGDKRSETITQTDHLHKFLVVVINRASLPKGVKHAQIAIFTKNIDDNNCNVRWLAKIEGRKSKKKKLVKKIKAEFEAYAIGFGSIKG